MADAPFITSALVVTEKGEPGTHLDRLLELMKEAGATISKVETAEEAAAQVLVSDPNEPRLIVIDAIGTDGRPTEDLKSVAESIARLRATLPHVAPVVVAPAPPPSLIVAAFRAGAADFIDLASDSKEAVRECLNRLAAILSERQAQRERIRELRSIVEDFLRTLIKTERRSIDLEHRLEIQDKRPTELTGDLDLEREPTIVVIEDDREVSDLLVDELEEVGVATYAFTSGEEAVREVTKLTKRGEAIDLALVDAKLPGIDGLEAIRRMRGVRPGLAAFLMTGYSDSQTAENAADLGVVGYVLKPFDDVGGLIERLKEHALCNRDLARERHYLQRIKERHEKVLFRYRKIAADLERYS
jgi:DNA-binding NtrC family response regulator